MADNYVYAVTRVHGHEQGLLSEADLEQLIAAKNVAEVFRLLGDKGWGDASLPKDDPDALVAYETDRTWALIEELAGEVAPFNVFRYANDYHNLKAAIKLAYSANRETDTSRYFIKYGTVDVSVLQQAALEQNFAPLPDAMAAAGREACEVPSRLHRLRRRRRRRV